MQKMEKRCRSGFVPNFIFLGLFSNAPYRLEKRDQRMTTVLLTLHEICTDGIQIIIELSSMLITKLSAS
jgi:hypothetical protein